MTEATENYGARRSLRGLATLIALSFVLTSCGVSQVRDSGISHSCTTSATTTSITEATTSTNTTSTAESQSTSTTPASEPDSALPAGWTRADVVEVLDGDTIEVRFEDGSEDTVRLIGINSPEGGECFATDAKAGLADLIEGATVLLEPDQSNRDQFGRLLRYIWTTDEQHVNEITVGKGWAIAREYPPDTARADELAAAQDRAIQAQAGLWAPDACGTAVPADIPIVHIEYDAPGNDNFNLNGEWVEIFNGDSTAVDLTGWVLKDESASHRYLFPNGFTLQQSDTLRVYTGCGQDTDGALYWCNTGSSIWNNGGDTAFLLDPAGNIVYSHAYG